jgi:NAD(P)-dependent dehydrogenase (short-subunit alcohol dehydrogenase family)
VKAVSSDQNAEKDRVILVTGSTDGIGKATALELARRGAHVILHGRDQEKGEAVLEEIEEKSKNHHLDLFIEDLSSLERVRKLAFEVEYEYRRMHVLINNAGVFMPERKLSEDGIEMTFTVNYLAPFLLTRKLLDLLRDSSPSRIINVASVAHESARMDWDNLQGDRQYDGFQAYAFSKLALIMFTYALAEKLEGTGITVNCLHPGVIKTKLLRAGFGDYPGAPPQHGARTPVYLATSPDVENVSGKYFENCIPKRSSSLSYDRKLQEKLWEISEKLTGVGP